MANIIQAPTAGSRIRTGWADAVTAFCNGTRVSSHAGMLARDGGGAFGHEPLPVNGRDRKPVPEDHGCWRIEYDEHGGYRTLGNRYYMVGDVLKSISSGTTINIDQYVGNGELKDGEDYTEADMPYICLRVPAHPNDGGTFDPADIIAYHTIDELREAQLDTKYSIRPLYKLTHSGRIDVDFRTIIDVQNVEVI